MKLIAQKILGTLLFGACLFSVAQAAPIRVGVVYGGLASGTDAAAQLNNDTYFDFTATAISASSADTAAELANFDVLVLGDSGHRDSGYTAAMYAAVKQFMISGRGVVTAGWYNYGTDLLAGQALVDANYITPIADANYNYDVMPGTVDILATHAITTGIADFNYSGNYLEYATAVDSGAVQLGGLVGTSNAVTIAYQDQVGRSVYLGGLYMADTAYYSTTGVRTGVQDRLFEQAVAWAASGSAQTSVPDASGTLALLGLGLASLAAARRRT